MARAGQIDAINHNHPSSSSHSSRLKRPVAAFLYQGLPYLLICLFFIRAHIYVSSTLAGTRALATSVRRSQSSGPISMTTSDPYAVCSKRLHRSISDLGDVGWHFLRHSGVGTPAKIEFNKEFHAANKFGCRCQIPEVYQDKSPRMTAVIQSFNHFANIHNISNGLKTADEHIQEIIVCEDGSNDGSLEEWSSTLKNPGQLIIRSNNLHELRSYNRALRIADGEFILLLQDDDLIPEDSKWVEDALQLFETYPDLGILGGYIGQLWNHSSKQGYEFGEQISTHAGIRRGNTKPIAYIDPSTNIPFMFVECAWIAPVFIRKSLVRKIGGLNLEIAKRGEPGVWQDCIYALEAWTNGFSVGVYHAPFKRGVGGHGSAKTQEKIKMRERVYDRAIALANRRYKRNTIHNMVLKRNADTLTARTNAKPPSLD